MSLGTSRRSTHPDLWSHARDDTRTFFYASGDLEADAGSWIIKGERDKVWNVVDDETFKWLTLKAQFLVDHLRVD
jgi:hypothetical protein